MSYSAKFSQSDGIFSGVVGLRWYWYLESQCMQQGRCVWVCGCVGLSSDKVPVGDSVFMLRSRKLRVPPDPTIYDVIIPCISRDNGTERRVV